MVSSKATDTAHAHQLTATNTTVARLEASLTTTAVRVQEGEQVMARVCSQVNGVVRDLGEGDKKHAALRLKVQRH